MAKLWELYQNTMLKLRRTIGKRVELAKLSNTRCHNCIFDLSSKCSSGVYNTTTGTIPFVAPTHCPVCEGSGYENTETIWPFQYASVVYWDPKTRGLDTTQSKNTSKDDKQYIRVCVSLEDVLYDQKSLTAPYQITFDVDTKSLTNVKIKGGTVEVKDITDTTLYTLDVDYSINNDTGEITRIDGGLILANDTVNINAYDYYEEYPNGKTLFDYIDYVIYNHQKFIPINTYKSGITEDFNMIAICEKSETLKK